MKFCMLCYASCHIYRKFRPTPHFLGYLVFFTLGPGACSLPLWVMVFNCHVSVHNALSHPPVMLINYLLTGTLNKITKEMNSNKPSTSIFQEAMLEISNLLSDHLNAYCSTCIILQSALLNDHLTRSSPWCYFAHFQPSTD